MERELDFQTEYEGGRGWGLREDPIARVVEPRLDRLAKAGVPRELIDLARPYAYAAVRRGVAGAEDAVRAALWFVAEYIAPEYIPLLAMLGLERGGGHHRCYPLWLEEVDPEPVTERVARMLRSRWLRDLLRGLGYRDYEIDIRAGELVRRVETGLASFGGPLDALRALLRGGARG